MDNSYYKTKKTVDEYIKLAKDCNGRHLIEKLKKFLPTNSNILEIGSGPGTDWNILKRDYEVVGSDNSKEFLKYLISNNPNGSFLELDAVMLQTETKFDAIYSNKVLHHLNDIELNDSIKRQHDILSENGIICHSFWEGEGAEIYNGLFVNYHSSKSITASFGELFEVLLAESYAEFEDEDSLLLIGKKR